MSVDTVNKMKEVFDIFDYDHSGQISIDELVNTIKALNMDNEAKNILSIVQNATSEDELDFGAFLEIFGQNDNQNEASLQSLYECFDPNNTKCFGPEDFEKAEKMFERRFREVQRTTKPKCISRDCSHWKCQKLCKFSEPVDGRFGSSPEDADKPVCQYFREMIDEKGIDYVTNEYANVSKIGAYGAGGGRLAEDTAKNDGKPSI